MLAKFVQEGDVVSFIATVDQFIGDVVVEGQLVGVVTHDTPANTKGGLVVEGVVDVVKATTVGSAIPVGSLVYWHTDILQANVTALGGIYMGKSTLPAADTDATVRIRMNQ